MMSVVKCEKILMANTVLGQVAGFDWVPDSNDNLKGNDKIDLESWVSSFWGSKKLDIVQAHSVLSGAFKTSPTFSLSDIS